MRYTAILLLLLVVALPACDELFPDDDDDSTSHAAGDGGTYTITIINERYDTVEIKLDGKYKGRLVGYKSDLEFTASGGSHTIEMHELLVKHGVKHVCLDNLNAPHRWDPSWMAPTLEALMSLTADESR